MVMHARNAQGRKVSLLNDEDPSQATEYHDSRQYDNAPSGSSRHHHSRHPGYDPGHASHASHPPLHPSHHGYEGYEPYYDQQRYYTPAPPSSAIAPAPPPPHMQRGTALHAVHQHHSYHHPTRTTAYPGGATAPLTAGRSGGSGNNSALGSVGPPSYHHQHHTHAHHNHAASMSMTLGAPPPPSTSHHPQQLPSYPPRHATAHPALQRPPLAHHGRSHSARVTIPITAAMSATSGHEEQYAAETRHRQAMAAGDGGSSSGIGRPSSKSHAAGGSEGRLQRARGYSTSNVTVSSVTPASSSAGAGPTVVFGPDGERRYACRFRESAGCDKTFTTSGHASRHAKIHTDEKNVACTFPRCGKLFTRLDNMKQHRETHYKDNHPGSHSQTYILGGSSIGDGGGGGGASGSLSLSGSGSAPSGADEGDYDWKHEGMAGDHFDGRRRHHGHRLSRRRERARDDHDYDYDYDDDNDGFSTGEFEYTDQRYHRYAHDHTYHEPHYNSRLSNTWDLRPLSAELEAETTGTYEYDYETAGYQR